MDGMNALLQPNGEFGRYSLLVGRLRKSGQDVSLLLYCRGRLDSDREGTGRRSRCCLQAVRYGAQASALGLFRSFIGTFGLYSCSKRKDRPVRRVSGVRLSIFLLDNDLTHSRNPYIYGTILQLISDGKVTLLHSLPIGPQGGVDRTHEQKNAWVDQQLALLTKSDLDLIHDCWTIFLTEFIGKSELRQEILEKDIMTNLTALQMEPFIRDKFRRFVVIKGSQEGHIPADKEGVSEHFLRPQSDLTDVTV